MSSERRRPWTVRAFCECGFNCHTAFGNIWFAQTDYPVCPDCGVSSDAFRLKTVRSERSGPWYWPTWTWVERPTDGAKP